MQRTERFDAILELLAQNGEVDIDLLAEQFLVSKATVRRDLNHLAGQQLLTRTRGGAVGQSVAYDLPLRYRREHHQEEKEAIACQVCRMIPKGSVIGISGGTTCYTLARMLASRDDLAHSSPRPNLTVVTNALNIAMHLALRPQIKVVVTGGVVNERSYELMGAFSEAVLRDIVLDTAWLGVNGIDPDLGPTIIDEDEARVNRTMAEHAKNAYLVTDSGKLFHNSFASLGPWSLFTGLVTDSGISARQVTQLEDQGLKVIVV